MSSQPSQRGPSSHKKKKYAKVVNEQNSAAKKKKRALVVTSTETVDNTINDDGDGWNTVTSGKKQKKDKGFEPLTFTHEMETVIETEAEDLTYEDE